MIRFLLLAAGFSIALGFIASKLTQLLSQQPLWKTMFIFQT
jgi:hypothetical protein